MTLWIFGYGSLIWRPDFAFVARHVARVSGWERRLEQGSPDHRGTPDRLGRVATLVPDPAGHCWGALFEVAAHLAADVLAQVDYRERGGYTRIELAATLREPSARVVTAVTWIASPDNAYHLGPASAHAIARQVRDAVGPSGTNVEYLRRLADALRELRVDDPHVFAVESALLGLLGERT